MDFCEKFCLVEDAVSKRFISDTVVVPHALTSMISDEDFCRLQASDRQFLKLYNDMICIYTAAYEAGFRIEPDSFGGFCLVNRNGRTIKSGVMDSTVGLLAKKPPNCEIDERSIMEGERLMVGVARWVNHSCRQNCDYYMSGGFNEGLVFDFEHFRKFQTVPS